MSELARQAYFTPAGIIPGIHKMLKKHIDANEHRFVGSCAGDGRLQRGLPNVVLSDIVPMADDVKEKDWRSVKLKKHDTPLENPPFNTLREWFNHQAGFSPSHICMIAPDKWRSHNTNMVLDRHYHLVDYMPITEEYESAGGKTPKLYTSFQIWMRSRVLRRRPVRVVNVEQRRTKRYNMPMYYMQTNKARGRRWVCRADPTRGRKRNAWYVYSRHSIEELNKIFDEAMVGYKPIDSYSAGDAQLAIDSFMA
jgi:hypothetical protein